MAQNPDYSRYHPKWYRKRIPIFWWVRKWAHFKFILRELTSLAVAFYALLLLLQVRALANGPEAYANFLVWLKSPLSVALNLVAFLLVLYHSVTWFNLSPKALVFRIGKTRIPGAMVAASNYAAWVVFTAVIAWILLSR
jgi:fumarate reductase subunit C